MRTVLAASSSGNFVDLEVHAWQWLVLLGLIVVLLLVDLLVFHREAHEISTKEAAIESAVWISLGVGFSLVVLWWFGGAATGEYISGYLIEKSLSVDNVFVWALLMSYFLVPQRYQHRVLFWGIFGALVMRAVFIFAGVALIEQFSWVLYVFGAFLLFTSARMLVSGETKVDPANSKILRLVNRIVPSTDQLDGPHLFTRINGRRLATPLFAVLLLVEATDVIFAVDSVPAVLAVSHEQFIVFSSNAFAILGLRALYFLLADLHNRFRYLQTGLAIILAFVGVKMISSQAFDYHMPTWLSLGVIGAVLAVSIGASLAAGPDPNDHFPTQLHEGPTAAEHAAPDAALAEAVHDSADAGPATDPRVTGDHK
jgi:tellurite resistance protein TerC